MERGIKIITAAILLLLLLVSAVNMSRLGERGERKMDDYFIENCQEETGSNNVVAGILFDYRGMDTLGEATVLFAAVSVISILFWRAEK